MNSRESGADPREQNANWKAPENGNEQKAEQAGEQFEADLKAKVLEFGEGWKGALPRPGGTVYPAVIRAENSEAFDNYLKDNGYTIVEEDEDTINFPTSANDARKAFIDKRSYNPDAVDVYFYRIGEKKIQ